VIWWHCGPSPALPLNYPHCAHIPELFNYVGLLMSRHDLPCSPYAGPLLKHPSFSITGNEAHADAAGLMPVASFCTAAQ
jgi:hypothetical protein